MGQLKNRLDELIALGLSSTLAFFFLIQSSVHPFNGCALVVDAGVFRTVAFMMEKGYMPYRDTFDHKGPIIYLINYLGAQIHYYRGSFVLEFISLVIVLFFMYKIAKLSQSAPWAMLTMVISLTMLFKYFGGGNLTEEYALPFITVSSFYFLDYYLNKTINKIRLVICGACFGGVLMLRPNMIAVWAVFCAAIFIKLIFEKEYKTLGGFMGWFIAGMLIIIVPIILWLMLNHSFRPFIEDYILFNKTYSNAISGVEHNKAVLETMKYFAKSKYFLFSFIGALCVIIKNKQLGIVYTIYMVVSIIFISVSGMTYDHYAIILIPVVTYPISYVFNEIINAFANFKLKNLVNCLILVATIGIILPNWISIARTSKELWDTRNENRIPYSANLIAGVANSFLEEDEKISVYGNWDFIYIISKHPHATKYSYQYPIGEVLPSIYEDYFKQLTEEQPRMIVIQRERFDERIQKFLVENKYKRFWTEYPDNSGAQIFMKAQ